jgi:hypothetical protein
MNKVAKSNLTLISIVLWAAIGFSTLALVYHIRWFIPFLQGKNAAVIPADHMPFIWFFVQICSNIIFLVVGFLLVKLFGKYRKTGFFDEGSLKVFDIVIIFCLALALLGAIQSIANNFAEVHLKNWTSIEAVANLVFRSFTRLIVFRDPQTFYLLLAMVLWTVRQFVTKALIIKKENDAFV